MARSTSNPERLGSFRSRRTRPAEKRRGWRRAALVRAFAPKEWPTARRGRGGRKWLMSWTMSRA